jgi:hypothetical protein
MRQGVEAWLNENNVPHVLPELLPSNLYADTSHPLTQGYEEMAKRLLTDPQFRQWLAK